MGEGRTKEADAHALGWVRVGGRGTVLTITRLATPISAPDDADVHCGLHTYTVC